MRDYRGKSGDERRAERRARLIAAGFELFGTQGYGATSVRALLREAGLQDRYFAESFASMEELLAAVYDEAHDAAFGEIVGAMDPAAPPAEQLRQLVDATTRKLEEDPRSARVIWFEALGAGPLVEEHRRRAVGKYATVVANVMPPLHPDCGLDRDVLARAVVAGINGLVMDWWANFPNMPRDHLVEHAMLLIRGVLREASAAPQGQS